MVEEWRHLLPHGLGKRGTRSRIAAHQFRHGGKMVTVAPCHVRGQGLEVHRDVEFLLHLPLDDAVIAAPGSSGGDGEGLGTEGNRIGRGAQGLPEDSLLLLDQQWPQPAGLGRGRPSPSPPA